MSRCVREAGDAMDVNRTVTIGMVEYATSARSAIVLISDRFSILKANGVCPYGCHVLRRALSPIQFGSGIALILQMSVSMTLITTERSKPFACLYKVHGSPQL